MSGYPSPEDIRASVADYRDPNSTTEERVDIRLWWEHYNIPNQFAAMGLAAAIERGEK